MSLYFHLGCIYFRAKVMQYWLTIQYWQLLAVDAVLGHHFASCQMYMYVDTWKLKISRIVSGHFGKERRGKLGIQYFWASW